MRGDRVEAALRLVDQTLSSRGHTPLLPAERTVGDEFQIVLAEAEAVVALVGALMGEGGWAVGVGVGAGELGSSARASEGEAFVYAREAVEAARLRSAVRPVVVRAGNADGAQQTTVIAQVLAAIVQGRTDAGRAAVAAMRGKTSQAQAAKELAITPQAFGQRLKVANYAEEQGQAELLVRGLRALEAVGEGEDK